MFEITINTIQSYCGNFICVGLFMICLIYSLFKNFNPKTNQLCFSCLLIIFILVNPLFLNFLVAHRFEGERISKTLCLLPIYIIIAIVFTNKIKNIKQLILVCFVLIITQHFAVTPGLYSFPSNIYKLEQSAIDVSDFVITNSTENNVDAKILTTAELATDIRLYAPQLKLEVGRRVEPDFDSCHQEELQLAISSNELDANIIQKFALEDHCTYIIFNNYKSIVGEFNQYIYVGDVSGYSIMRIIQ